MWISLEQIGMVENILLGRLSKTTNWKEMDINRKLVSAGYAWVYDKYVTDNSFYENQSKARNLNSWKKILGRKKRFMG